MRVRYGLCIILCLCLWLTNNCIAARAPIPAEQAFIFNIYSENQHILLNWQIAPNYFLYKGRIKIKLDPNLGVKVDYPQGDLKYSEDLGRYEVYKNTVNIPVKLPPLPKSATLTVTYQGCAESGFCYPPVSKSYSLNTALSLTPVYENQKPPPEKRLLTNQQGVTALFESHNVVVTFLLFICLGLLLAFTPCVLPMVPILTSIIVGQRKDVSTKKAFLLSLTYVVGMALTYALAGVLVTKLGGSLQVWLQKPWIIALVSLLFVLLAFSLFGFYHLRLPHRVHHRLHHASNQLPGGSYVGVFLMGVISTLIVSPCVTAPLVGVLVFIGQTGDMFLGASALFAIGLGMGIPLLIIGMSAGRWLPKHGPWMEAVKVTFGILMLAMAVWLFSRILSPLHALLLWGLFLVVLALFIALYLPRVHKRHYLTRTLSIVVALVGIFLIFSSEFRPVLIQHWLYFPEQKSSSFITVRTIDEVNKQLSQAQKSGRPVLMDFYASWCESCIKIERTVFANSNVKEALEKTNFVLLRVDLTANDTNAQTLLSHYNVIAPPTILFFTQSGKEMVKSRIVGEITADEFLARLAELNLL